MNYIFDERQKKHDPKFRLENGKVVQNPDRPKRIEFLLKGAIDAGLIKKATRDFGKTYLERIHSKRYINYLETIFEERSKEVAGLVEVVPTRVCRDKAMNYPNLSDAKIGFHSTDTSCPISKSTWQSVYWSAQCAITAADEISQGQKSVYALCRPSGHHAYPEMAVGFCYLNNSAIAAEYLLSKGLRPAILDIDVHHGNGTQEIFYNRSDVLTVSIHADPNQFYPFYTGCLDETGFGDGLGFNLNLPLPRYSNYSAYQKALNSAAVRIKEFSADVIVVALGLDAHIDDPFHGMSLTTENFFEIAQVIKAYDLPILNVQEGGYIQPLLADNLTSYLSAFN